MIVDAGKFDWAASGRFKDFTEPDPSYHGLSYTEAFGPLAFILKARVQGLRDTGAALSPFNAFLLLQGIETLHLRMERHSQNALAVAKHLEQHPGVEWVNYPGLESSRVLRAGKEVYARRVRRRSSLSASRAGYEAGKKLIDSLELFSLLANIGDAKSLVIHPASTTHQQLRLRSRRPPASRPRWCGFPWASRTSATSWPTSTRRSRSPTGTRSAAHQQGGTLRHDSKSSIDRNV